MNMWNWIILLQIIGLCAMIAEVFIPSAGLLVALMFGATGLSIWLAYDISSFAGTMVLAADLLLLPIAGWYALTKVPSTPAALRDQLDGTAADGHLVAFVGQYGVCQTDLRPVGRVKIGSDIVEAQAPHGFIPKGTPVHIARMEGGHLFVETTSAAAPGG